MSWKCCQRNMGSFHFVQSKRSPLSAWVHLAFAALGAARRAALVVRPTENGWRGKHAGAGQYAAHAAP